VGSTVDWEIVVSYEMLKLQMSQLEASVLVKFQQLHASGHLKCAICRPVVPVPCLLPEEVPVLADNMVVQGAKPVLKSYFSSYSPLGLQSLIPLLASSRESMSIPKAACRMDLQLDQLFVRVNYGSHYLGKHEVDFPAYRTVSYCSRPS